MGEDRHVPPSPRLPQTRLRKKTLCHSEPPFNCRGMRHATYDIACDDESAQNSRQVGQEATGLDWTKGLIVCNQHLGTLVNSSQLSG